jgi:hypothetical protein
MGVMMMSRSGKNISSIPEINSIKSGHAIYTDHVDTQKHISF